MIMGNGPFSGQARQSSAPRFGGGQPQWSSWFNRPQQGAANDQFARRPIPQSPYRPPGLMTPPANPAATATPATPQTTAPQAPVQLPPGYTTQPAYTTPPQHNNRISPALPAADQFITHYPEFRDVDPNSPEGKLMMQSRLLMGYGNPAPTTQPQEGGSTYGGHLGFQRWANENWGADDPRIPGIMAKMQADAMRPSANNPAGWQPPRMASNQ